MLAKLFFSLSLPLVATGNMLNCLIGDCLRGDLVAGDSLAGDGEIVFLNGLPDREVSWMS